MKRLCLIVFVLLAIACMWLLLPSPVSASGYGYKSYSYYPSYSSGYSYSYPSYSYSYPSYNVQTVYQYKEVPVYKDVVRIKEVTVPTYAVVPLYSSFYQPQQQPAAAPCANGHTGMAATAGAAPAATAGAPAATAAAPGTACAEANAKVDKLQAQVELLVRLLGPAAGGAAPLGAAAGTAPATTPPPPPPTKPKAPAVKEPDDGEQVKATMQAGVNVMYTACVQCHEKQVAATKGNNFTIFDGRNIILASERAWDKVEYEVREGKMPPKTDVEGKPVPELAATQRKVIRDFLALRKAQVARTAGAE